MISLNVLLGFVGCPSVDPMRTKLLGGGMCPSPMISPYTDSLQAPKDQLI